MRLDDLRPSDNVEDRRGEGYAGGGFGGLGPGLVFRGGGLGLVAVLVISLLFGVDPSQLLSGGPVTEPQARHQTGPRADDADYNFARRVIRSAGGVWGAPLRPQRERLPPPPLP